MDTISLYLIAAAFGLHGIGMLGSALTLPLAIQKSEKGFGHSWLLARFGTQVEAVAGSIIWGLAGIGFLVAGIGLALGASWWEMGAWLGAPMTIIAIVLWFGAVPMGTYVGGVLAALTLGALVYFQTR